MAGVTIDIPGVGNVEAKNAATESTLREILKVMQGVQKNTTGGPGAGAGAATAQGGGGGGGVMSSLQKSAAGAGKALAVAGKGLSGIGTIAGGLGKGLGMAAGAVTKVATGGIMVAKMFGQVAESSANLVQDLSNVGDSLTAAAGTLRNIPIVGGILSTVLGAVAAAAEKSATAYKAAAASGASFGGSMQSFSRSASEAGMTMEQFGQLIGKNGEGMLAFGSTTEEGAKRFSQVSKALRSTSSELYALGFGTAEINQGLASYGKLMRMQGLQGTQTNSQLAAGAKSYLKEMDLLAKATGQERAQVEDRMARMAQDAQFQASMAGLNKDVRDSFLAVTTGLPKGLDDFAKDIMATGTATTEENQKLMAMMPQSAAMLQQMNAKMQRGEAVTLAERQALNNMMKKEGGQNLKNIKQAGAASAELSGTVNRLAATQEINTNGLVDANNAQKDAAAATDGQLKTIEESKAKLAEFSNTFTQFLASSGLLDLLMGAFKALATFTTNVVLPVFQVVAGVLQKVWFGFETLLKPINDSLKPALESLGGSVKFIDSILNATFSILNGLVRGGILAFEGLFNGVMGLIQPIQDLYTAVFGASNSVTGFSELLIDVGSTIGGIFEFLGAVLKDVIGVVISVVGYFKDLINKSEFLSGVFRAVGNAFEEVRRIMSPAGWQLIKEKVGDFFMSTISDTFGNLNDWFGELIDNILFMIPDALGGLSKEEKKKRDEEREERKKLREEEAATRKVRIAEAEKAVNADSEKRKEKADEHKKQLKEDNKKFAEKSALEQKGIDDKKEKQREEERLNKNYQDPIQLLKDEAKQQKSNLIPVSPEDKKTQTASAQRAEGARKTMETEAEKQKRLEAEAAKQSEEERRQKETGKGTGAPGQKAPTTQESAETLLASLNSKMDKLISLNIRITETADRQLTVQQGLTGDLFRV